LETRKYTDQAGQEKYTTEVVLRNFRGELTLLDSAAGSEADSGGGGGGGYRERAPAQRAPAAAGAGPRGGGPSWDAPKGGDLDDEIPF
jgi:single-strand DNA-binding protein